MRYTGNNFFLLNVYFKINVIRVFQMLSEIILLFFTIGNLYSYTSCKRTEILVVGTIRVLIQVAF